MTEVTTFTGITIAQSLHVACAISIGSPSWFETEICPVLHANPHAYVSLNGYMKEESTRCATLSEARLSA